MTRPYTLLIRRAQVFDGDGHPPVTADVALRDGRVAAISAAPLSPDDAQQVIEAEGLWLTPGFIDIHTHYDAELLIAPALSESLRHGVTTCFVGSCSISMVCCEPEDASDIFTRVESIPRERVLPVLQRVKTWRDPAGYVRHLQGLPLGPNVASFLGHSDLRAAVMGLGRSVDPRVRPSEAELQQMERLLDQALDEGLLGLSAMTNPWDKVDGDRHRSAALPSVYATWREYRRLHALLRRRGAILQSAPNLNNPINAVAYMLTSAALGVRRQLKTTLITLMDIKARPGLDRLSAAGAALFNRWLGAAFRMQALPQPFKVYADGIDFVVFEEFPAGEAALHLTRELDRQRLFGDPGYRERFRRECLRRWGGRVWHRDFGDAHIIDCPDARLVGKTVQQVARERGEHDALAFLDLLIEHGRGLRWSTVIGNHDPARLAANLNNPSAIVGFSDAGAHLRNMAFYNFGLCLLQLALREPAAMTPEKAVWRLTGEIADWFGLDVGRLRPGGGADMVLIDPAALRQARLDTYAEAPFEELGGLRRVVNRHDGVVKATIVNGRIAFADDRPAADLGRAPVYGRFLKRQATAAA
jgi:N-acyl-D-aspartate/D-glutamate deacylase